jgi:alkyldihydroxyacetonephosphate synthase
MILGISGKAAETSHTRARAMEVVRSFGGLNTGTVIGEQWRRSRFKTPYLRNTLWELGYALDTLETALPWSLFDSAHQQTLGSIQQTFADRSLPSLVFSHLSHVYQDGASFYITYIFARADNPQATLAAWRSVKAAASEMIRSAGGTISHQHGVGQDHRHYLLDEKGKLGLQMLRSLANTLDPDGLLNPGKLFDGGSSDRA